MDKQHNFKPVAEIIATINRELERQTQAWKAIGAELYELKSTYGFQSEEAQAVIEATGWNKSTISKLAKIGGDDRLSDPLFRSVDAWSVLYDVATLNNVQLDQLKEQLSAEPKLKLTSALIDGIKNPEVEPNSIIEVFRATVPLTLQAGSFSPFQTQDRVIRALTNSKTVMIEVDLSEHLECDINVRDISLFLKMYDAMSEPTVSFETDSIAVSDTKTGFRYSVPNNTGQGCGVFLKQSVNFDFSEDPKFSIDRAAFSWIVKLSAVIPRSEFVISAYGGRLRGMIFGENDECCEIDLGATECTSEFEALFKPKDLGLLMEGDYIASVSREGISRWERANTDYNPVYNVWVGKAEKWRRQIDMVLGLDTKQETEELKLAA